MIKPDASTFGLGDEGAADVLRTVIAANRQRLAAPLDDLIQGPYDPLRRQRQIDIDS